MLLAVTGLRRRVVDATELSIVSVGNVTVGMGGEPATAFCVKETEAVSTRLRRANVIFFMVIRGGCLKPRFSESVRGGETEFTASR